MMRTFTFQKQTQVHHFLKGHAILQKKVFRLYHTCKVEVAV